MDKHTFKLSISGDQKMASKKAKALAVLGAKLDAKTLTALADVVNNDPAKVQLAKQFLGV